MNLEPTADRFPHTGAIAWLAIAATSAAVGFLALGREFLTFGTEADFVSGFVNQARSVLEGEPLRLGFHPPLYPLVLAVSNGGGGDWFATGLLVSWASAVAALVCQYGFFRLLLHREAGLGAIVALAASATFLTYAAMATSDLLFFALWSAALWLSASAGMHRTPGRWAAAGALVAFAALARINGATLLVLTVLPWLAQPAAARRARWAGVTAWSIGLSVPLALWTAGAALTGSDLLPRQNYANLAMTYFGSGDRVAGESRLEVERRFDGLWDVVTHDPKRMARSYVRDLRRLPRRLVESDTLTWSAMIVALAGLLVFVRRMRGWVAVVFVAAVALQAAVVNLKTFEARYWIFLLPWIGALAGAGIAALLTRLGPRGLRAAAACALLVWLGVISTGAHRAAAVAVHRNDLELDWLVTTIRASIPANALVVARKMHLGFYTDVRMRGFPNVESIDALRAALAGDTRNALYVYYGSIERARRPELRALSDPSRAPDWLEPVAVHPGADAWVLYRATTSAAATSR
jgi:hypothetical protein